MTQHGCEARGQAAALTLAAAVLSALPAPALAQASPVVQRDALAFGPATPVSVTFVAPEPTLSVERQPSAGRRLYVSSLLGGGSLTTQIHRSVDGGDSFRTIVDPACAARQRPTCVSEGGGDADAQLNSYTGTLLFGELGNPVDLLNVPFATSTDGGDSFPPQRQYLLTNNAPRPDRPWVTPVDPGLASVGRRLGGLLSHAPPEAGIYVHGVTEDGIPLPQPVQLPLLSRLGRPQVDHSDGPGRGWIYVPYLYPEVGVATAPLAGYALPTEWAATTVAATHQGIFFPALALDGAGNAYVVWNDKGVALLSVSPIADPRNGPSTGRPGSYWTPPAPISPPDITSVALPTVTAGDAGRIAVAFLGSTDCVGLAESCDDDVRWRTYAAVAEDALGTVRGEPLHLALGLVSGRVNHRGKICERGGACATDRSLLEYIEARVTDDGRLGVAFMDNNNRMSAPNLTDPAKDRAFAFFAWQRSGPSLLAGRSPLAASPAPAGVDAAGDATWPATASGLNLAALDLLGATLSLEGDQLVARLSFADPTTTGLTRDLDAFNADAGARPPAERLQSMLWFATADDVFHLSMEAAADGAVRFFGGRLDENDRVLRAESEIATGARYVTDDAIPVAGALEAGGVTLRAPASAFGIVPGTPVFSVTGVAMAAPAEDDPSAGYFLNSATTVDATPPADVTLAPPPTLVAPLQPPLRLTLGAVPRRLDLDRLVRRGLRLRVRASGSLTATAALTIGRRDARWLRLRVRRGQRSLALAQRRVAFAAAGERRVTLRVARPAARRPRRARGRRIPARVIVTGGGARDEARVTLRARR